MFDFRKFADVADNLSYKAVMSITDLQLADITIQFFAVPDYI